MRLHRSLILTGVPGAVTDAHAAIARDVVAASAIRDQGWLAPGACWRAVFVADGAEPTARVRERVVEALGSGAAVDVNVLAHGGNARRARLLVADMESTVIEQELIDELADYVGLRDKVAAITDRAMRGELEFEGALRERVALLAGLDARVLDEVYAQRVTLMPGAAALIAALKAQGTYCALVSGGFSVFAAPVAARLGFDEHQANMLEVEQGRLTGRVREPILGRAAKREALLRIAARLGIDSAETMAVGDGANDLDMLAAAGLGVAFRAKPKVQEAARALANGAVVVHADLTALIYLQDRR